MSKHMGLIKHVIWALVVVFLGAFAVIFFGTPEQGEQILDILTGLGLAGLIALSFLWIWGFGR